MTWSARDTDVTALAVGRTVILEVTCRDARHASELCEVLAHGIRSDGFAIDFSRSAGLHATAPQLPPPEPDIAIDAPRPKAQP